MPHRRLNRAFTTLSQGLLHPTLAYSPGHGLLCFAMVSLPIWQAYANPADQDRFRIGTGVIYTF